MTCEDNCVTCPEDITFIIYWFGISNSEQWNNHKVSTGVYICIVGNVSHTLNCNVTVCTPPTNIQFLNFTTIGFDIKKHSFTFDEQINLKTRTNVCDIWVKQKNSRSLVLKN